MVKVRRLRVDRCPSYVIYMLKIVYTNQEIRREGKGREGAHREKEVKNKKRGLNFKGRKATTNLGELLSPPAQWDAYYRLHSIVMMVI
jgi:hypothetical protein